MILSVNAKELYGTDEAKWCQCGNKRERQCQESNRYDCKITDAVVEGNTHQYILLENDSDIYDVSVVDYLDIVRYGVGDTITFEYMEGEQANTVLGIEK